MTNASVYLTEDELQMLLEGLNCGLANHYNDYDCMPDDIITLFAKIQTVKNDFQRCKCGKRYYKDYSWSVCCKEEEE